MSSSHSSSPTTTFRMLPVAVKIQACVVYARVAGNEALQVAFERIARSFQVGLATAQKIADLPLQDIVDKVRFSSPRGESAMHYLLLARAVAPTPADLPPELIAILKAGCDPRALVDLVHVVAVAQMLHRLYVALFADKDEDDKETQHSSNEDA
mmetsp:Transcript_28810/g.92786  ORF Transcript_28810/g.92786 Transcript_28810/m.92786 type:complete len:154 (-) Transcript_28810:2790-3251(-)